MHAGLRVTNDSGRVAIWSHNSCEWPEVNGMHLDRLPQDTYMPRAWRDERARYQWHAKSDIPDLQRPVAWFRNEQHEPGAGCLDIGLASELRPGGVAEWRYAWDADVLVPRGTIVVTGPFPFVMFDVDDPPC